MRITEKRATLYREWVLATIANDESYYCSTLMLGIPDGDDAETVMDDLKSGFYDEDIDETIDVYIRAKKRYARHGYYVNEKLFDSEDDALKETGMEIPAKIYKHP